MRSNWLLTSLLLFSFIINEAQGIRLRKGTISLPADHREHNIHEIVPWKRNNDGIIDEKDEAVVICAGEKCSGRTNRKLIVTTPSSTIKTAKLQNDKNKANKDHDHLKSEDNSTDKSIQKKEENLSVNSSSAITEEHRPTPEPYPDVIDIAGMDYSQARRRPPIHN